MKLLTIEKQLLVDRPSTTGLCSHISSNEPFHLKDLLKKKVGTFKAEHFYRPDKALPYRLYFEGTFHDGTKETWARLVHDLNEKIDTLIIYQENEDPFLPYN